MCKGTHSRERRLSEKAQVINFEPFFRSRTNSACRLNAELRSYKEGGPGSGSPRSIERIETREDGSALLHVEGEASVEINIQELNVFLNPAVRRGLQDFVAPLEEKGAESLSVSAGDESPSTIFREEIGYFAPKIPGETVSTNVSEARLEIISPQFREGTKWRFQHGSVTFFAAIADEAFLSRVAQGDERFGSGDVLTVDLETKETVVGGRVDVARTIILVRAHHRREQVRQLGLLPPDQP